MLRSKAVVLGSEANKKAESGQYYSAIELFSKAIELHPFDYRFYLNRAFCYEKTELYHLALADSEEAIRLNHNIEKCYFRKARALVGLREYTKAEHTYKYVLEMNPNCSETRDDLIRMRSSALIDMGFDKQTAIKASNNYNSIREAIDGLLSERISVNNNNFNTDYSLSEDLKNNKTNNDFNQMFRNLDLNDNNISDSFNKFIISAETGTELKNEPSNEFEPSGDRYADKARNWAQLAETQPLVKSNDSQLMAKCGEKLLKPTNIWNYNGLRVENVNVDNKKAILKRFSVFGKVKVLESVRNSKTSVWVHYDNPVSPIDAISRMQGSISSDINHYNKGQAVPLRIFFAPTNDQTELKFCRPKQPPDNKGECYYWRTTNCSLEDNCPLIHIMANKHIDAQVWMKTKDGKPI